MRIAPLASLIRVVASVVTPIEKATPLPAVVQWSRDLWYQRRTVVIADVDHTLTGFLMPDFLRWLLRKNPRDFLKRTGWRMVPELAAALTYSSLHFLGIRVPRSKLTRLGENFLTRILRGRNPDALATTWWAERRAKLIAPFSAVHEQFNACIAGGARPFLGTSEPGFLVAPLAREMGILPKDCIASGFRIDPATGRVRLHWQEGDLKGNLVARRMRSVDHQLRLLTLHGIDKGKSRILADSPKDFHMNTATGIIGLTAVGPAMTSELKMNGGERMLLSPEGAVTQRYERRARGYQVTMETPLPAVRRYKGLLFSPLQWLAGDLISEAILEGGFSNLGHSIASIGLLSSFGAGAELLSRGAYNRARDLPFGFADSFVRTGFRGSLFHTAGSLAGFGMLEFYHGGHTGILGSVGHVALQSSIQLASAVAARQALLGALKLFGNPFLNLLGEAVLAPVAEFTAMKWLSKKLAGRNHREQDLLA